MAPRSCGAIFFWKYAIGYTVLMPPAPNIPAIFTIFGVTGDLARKKIVPSLWYLHEEKRLPERIEIIGFARRDLSASDFKTLVKNAVESTSSSSVEEKDFEKFFALFSYHR